MPLPPLPPCCCCCCSAIQLDSTTSFTRRLYSFLRTQRRGRALHSLSCRPQGSGHIHSLHNVHVPCKMRTFSDRIILVCAAIKYNHARTVSTWHIHLFSLYSRAASELAGELGLGSLRSDCACITNCNSDAPAKLLYPW